MTREEKAVKMRKTGYSIRSISKELGVHHTTVTRMLESAGHEEPKETTAIRGGLSLAGRNVLKQKPTNVWPGRFRSLRKGVGYPLEVLAESFGVSVECVKEKARRQKCLRYVEADAGEYVACVVHPDTEAGL